MRIKPLEVQNINIGNALRLYSYSWLPTPRQTCLVGLRGPETPHLVFMLVGLQSYIPLIVGLVSTCVPIAVLWTPVTKPQCTFPEVCYAYRVSYTLQGLLDRASSSRFPRGNSLFMWLLYVLGLQKRTANSIWGKNDSNWEPFLYGLGFLVTFVYQKIIIWEHAHRLFVKIINVTFALVSPQSTVSYGQITIAFHVLVIFQFK